MPAHRPIECPHCHKVADMQLLYTVYQAAHILNKTVSAINNLMSQGRLKYRLGLTPWDRITRYVDYFQLWEFIETHFPTIEQLEEPNLNPTQKRIKHHRQWRQKLSKATWAARKERKEQELARSAGSPLD